MKVAVCSDLHLQGKDYRQRLHWVRRMLFEAAEAGCEAVLCCGDVFHYRKVGDARASAPEILSAFRDVVYEGRLPWFVAKGNHDGEGPGPEALGPLQGPLFIPFSDRPQGFVYRGHRFLALPWLAWDGQPRFGNRCLEAALTEAARLGAPDYPVVAFGHMAVVGAVCGNRPLFEASSGDDPRWHPTPSDLSYLGVRYLLLGHVHRRQVIGVRGCSWAGYVGALTRLNFGEADHPDGWMLLDLAEAGCATWVPADGPRYVTTSDADVRDEIDFVKEPQEVRLTPSREVLGADLEQGLGALWWAWRSRENFSWPPGPVQLGEGDLDLQLSPLAQEHLSKLIQEAGESHGVRGPSVRFLRRLKFTGFRGALEAREIRFQPGWNALLGPNGVGKTTILEGLYAVLFGRWPTQGREGWNSVTPTPEKARIEAEFDSGAFTWKVERAGGKCLVWRQDTEDFWAREAGPGVKEAQAFCKEQFGDAEGWLKLCLLNQSGRADLVDATDEERMRTMRVLLGLDEVQAIGRLAEQELRMLPHPQIAEHQRALEVLEREAAEAEAALEAFEPQVEPLRLALTRAEVSWDKLREKLARCRVVADDLARAEQAEARERRVVASWEDLRNNYSDQLEKAETYQAAQAELTEKEAEFRRLHAEEFERQGLIRKIADLKERAAPLERAGCRENLIASCPFILQALEAGQKLPLLEADLEARPPQNLGGLEARLKALRSVPRVEVPSALGEVEAKLLEAQEALQATSARVRELRQEFNSYTGITVDEAQVAREVARDRKEFLEAQDRLTLLRVAAEGARKRLQDARAELIRRTQQALSRQALEALAQAFGPRGIPQLLIAEALPDLQAEIDAALEASGLPLRLRVETLKELGSGELRESLSLLMERNGDGVWYDVRWGSSGERGFLRLVLRVAILRSRQAAGILLLDEPTAAMAPDFTEGAISMLRALGDRFAQVIVTTHDEELAEEVGGAVRIG